MPPRPGRFAPRLWRASCLALALAACVGSAAPPETDPGQDAAPAITAGASTTAATDAAGPAQTDAATTEPTAGSPTNATTTTAPPAPAAPSPTATEAADTDPDQAQIDAITTEPAAAEPTAPPAGPATTAPTTSTTDTEPAAAVPTEPAAPAPATAATTTAPTTEPPAGPAATTAPSAPATTAPTAAADPPKTDAAAQPATTAPVAGPAATTATAPVTVTAAPVATAPTPPPTATATTAAPAPPATTPAPSAIATTTAPPAPPTTTAPSTTTTAVNRETGPPRRYRPQPVEILPHDRTSFTQGLAWRQGVFYESAGLYGKSSVRIVDPATGEVIREQPLPDRYFGEGLEVVGDRVVQLTWREETAFIWETETLAPLGTFSYQGEGWGLCAQADRFVMSDGSDVLTFRHLETFAPLGSVRVARNGEPVTRLNELECAGGLVYANIWLTDLIAVIDPDTGAVTALVDCSGLAGLLDDREGIDVLNGIAYRPDQDRFFLTGKLWPNLFLAEMVPDL